MKRRAAAVLSLAVIVVLGIWLGTSIRQPSAALTTAPQGIPSRPAEAFPLTVRYVYDGDTIQGEAQHPNEIVTTHAPIRIRLIGIDTPESTPAPECWAHEARAHLIELLPEGATVWAAPDRDTWDDYGRRLFNLWTDDGRFVQHELVAAGDAEAIRIRPNVAYHELLTATQAAAHAQSRGQWGACP